MKVAHNTKYAICVHSENVYETMKAIPFEGAKGWHEDNYVKWQEPASSGQKIAPTHYILRNLGKSEDKRRGQIRKDIARTLWLTKTDGNMNIIATKKRLFQLQETLTKAPYLQTLLSTGELDMHIKTFAQQYLYNTKGAKNGFSDFAQWLFSSNTPSQTLFWTDNWQQTPLKYYSVQIRTPLGLLGHQSLIITSTRIVTGNISEITDEKLYCVNEWKEGLHALYNGTHFGNLFVPSVDKPFRFNSWKNSMLASQYKNVNAKTSEETSNSILSSFS